MDAVGDVLDRHLVRRDLRPDIVPHLSADVAVQPAHGVGAVCETDRQHRHAEALLLVHHVLAAEREEAFVVEF